MSLSSTLFWPKSFSNNEEIKWVSSTSSNFKKFINKKNKNT